MLAAIVVILMMTMATKRPYTTLRPLKPFLTFFPSKVTHPFHISLLIGFAYLLWRKVISARIPVAYIATVAVLTFLFPLGNDRIAWMMAQVFGGGLMLGAIFMATDYVTSPVTKLGQLIYGIGCGVLTVMIRYFGGYNEGVSYAILCMNACVVLLDRIGRPVKFGAPKKEAAK